jgi:hypothetical protein
MEKNSEKQYFKLNIDDFNRQEIILHQAAQLIALTGINLLEPLPDDSQNTLIYEADRKLLLGREFQLAGKSYSIGIKPAAFELVLYHDRHEIKTLQLAELEKQAVLATWADWLKDLGVTTGLTTQLHYQLPVNENYAAANYGPLADEFIDQWLNLRSLANSALANLNKLTQIESEINIWPHHFDTGVYYPWRTADDEVVASVGAGLAIADSMISEPYFYIYGYKKNTDLDFAEAPGVNPGKWLTEGWKGAVLPVTELSELESSVQVDAFFKRSFEFFATRL